MDIYREIILDHYKHPRNFGHLPRPDAKVEEGNVTCGDRISIEIKVNGKRKKEKFIEDIRFSGEGCAISQASASMLTEKVKGKNVTDIKKLDLQYMFSMLGTTLTPTRTKCALLPLEVLQKALTKIRP
jgi:nitrogen fixation protein NifU and related proteins